QVGNVNAGYLGTIHFTSTDSQATLPANYTFTTGVTGDNGCHTFTNGVVLKTSGSQSVTASDTVTPAITGSQTGIVVNPAAASTLVVAGFPSPITAGTAGNVTVTARDTYGNTATGYLGTVAFTSTDLQAVLPANYAFVAADAGVHVFSVTLKTSGTQSITAKDTITGTITGTQSGITVNPAGTSSLLVAGFPSPVTAGTAANVTVTAKDAFNNTTPAYVGTV